MWKEWREDGKEEERGKGNRERRKEGWREGMEEERGEGGEGRGGGKKLREERVLARARGPVASRAPQSWDAAGLGLEPRVPDSATCEPTNQALSP